MKRIRTYVVLWTTLLLFSTNGWTVETEVLSFLPRKDCIKISHVSPNPRGPQVENGSPIL